MKKYNWPKFLHFRLFLAPEIESSIKNTSKMVYFKKFERIFSAFLLLSKMHIFAIKRYLKEADS